MALSHEIWQDLGLRLHNLRVDMVTQWQGDIDNPAIERAIGALGATIQAWRVAEPLQAPSKQPPTP